MQARETVGIFPEQVGSRVTGIEQHSTRKTEGEYLQVPRHGWSVGGTNLLTFFIDPRPGLIGPHKQTGHANLQDWVYWLVKGLLRLGLAPVGMGCQQKHLHWVPVDQVAKAVALTSLERRGEKRRGLCLEGVCDGEC